MGRIYEEATNSKQYDSDSVAWKEDFNSPSRKFFYEYVKRYSGNLKNLNVLEIGSGTGWLLELLRKDVFFIEGIEPSKKNFKFAKQQFSKINISCVSFEKFRARRKYDLIIAIMVFNHLKKVSATFEKIQKLLDKEGRLLIIVPDFKYAREKRFGYKIKTEEISEHEYAVEGTREYGRICDVVRDVGAYEKAARKEGLLLTESIPLFPTPDLIKHSPKYKEFEQISISQMLIFKQNTFE